MRRSNSTEAITNLHKVMEWDKDTTSISVQIINNFYYRLVTSSLSDIIQKIDTNRELSLKQLLKQLSNNSFMRIIKSPQVCYYLFHWNWINNYNEIIDFLRNVIAAELILENKPAEINNVRLWSALGDVSLVRNTRLDNWIKSNSSLHIENAILLDTHSPYNLYRSRRVVVQKEKIVPYSKRLELSIYLKLLNAYKIIFEVSSIIKRFIVASTVVVSAIPNDDEPLSFNSASQRSRIGEITLVNAHLDGIRIDKMISMLIHESIHSYLYKVELEQPFVPEMQHGWQIKICSPWSGKSLRLTTYVHACYVYYGLLNYWTSALNKCILDEIVIKRYLQSLYRGFLLNNLTLETVPCKSLINRITFEDLCRMNQKALSILANLKIND